MASSPPKRLAPDARRRQLLDAAVLVFADADEEAVGLRDVADAAGITRNLLYRYFDGKGDLHRAAVLLAVQRLSTLMESDPSVPLDEKVPGNIARWLDAIERGDPDLRLVRRAGRSGDPAVRAVAAAAREALVRAIARNHLGDEDPPRRVVAALHGYLAMAEALNAAWLEDGHLERADVERLLAAALPPLVQAAA